MLGPVDLVGGGAPDLAHGFDDVVHPVDVALAEQATVGVDGELPSSPMLPSAMKSLASPGPQNPSASSCRNTTGLKFS